MLGYIQSLIQDTYANSAEIVWGNGDLRALEGIRFDKRYQHLSGLQGNSPAVEAVRLLSISFD